MTSKKHYEYACLYTDGGMRTLNDIPGAGAGVHGYFFNDLPSMRFAGVKHLITLKGYHPKPTGKELVDCKKPNPTYNPTIENWGLVQSFVVDGAPCAVEKECDVVLIDGWRGIIDRPTNNRGEMQALIDVFNHCPFTADNYYILADSMLVINGFNKDMGIWKARDWRKGDGQEPKNLDLWKVLDEIKTKFGDKIQLGYIKAHDGHFGNESADRNATHGVVSAVNGDTEMHWVTSPLMDKQYWDPSKPIPPMMRSKWCYSMVGKPRTSIQYNDCDYYAYFCGDHSKDADDADLLGKEISDAGFSLIFTKDKVDIIERLQAYHADNMWKGISKMYRSDVVNMVNINNVNKPKELWRFNNVNLESLLFKSHRNDLVSSDEQLLSQMLRPAKLSYRSESIENELHTVFQSTMAKLGHKPTHPSRIIALPNTVVNDVTDLFYETPLDKNGKAGATKLTDMYDLVAKSLPFNVKHPCGEEEANIVLTRGIDMPSRNIMSAIADEHPKVYITTWMFSKISFKYAMVILTDETMSVWEGYYSCNRVLDL